MIAWLTRHAQTSVGTLGRLARHKVATLLTALVIAVALALPTCLHLLVLNVQSAAEGWDRGADLTVFLKRPTAPTAAQSLANRWAQRRDVAGVEVVLADDAFREFRRESGLGAALDALNDNPLPHTVVVTPSPEHSSAAQIEALAAELNEDPSVDVVQVDAAWVRRLEAILAAVQRGLLLVGGVLALGVIVVVGNTIRLDIQSRRAEIEIVKLVGGSDGFVRRPFLYTGAWYGLAGAVLALAATAVALGLLRGPVARIAGLYESDFQLRGLGLEASALVLAVGVGLGWLGSFVAATRHLREVEPS